MALTAKEKLEAATKEEEVLKARLKKVRQRKRAAQKEIDDAERDAELEKLRAFARENGYRMDGKIEEQAATEIGQQPTGEFRSQYV